MEPQTPQPAAGAAQTPGTNLDSTALALSRAIRQVESGGDYNAVGDNGKSWGAYQWHNDNFQSWAKQYGLDPSDTSQKNQDHLAYARIKDYLDKGVPQSQIAAIWNGAKYENGQYKAINPEYVQKVKDAYGTHSDQTQSQNSGNGLGSFTPPSQKAVYQTSNQTGSSNQQNTPQPQSAGLGQELTGRITDAGNALSDTLSGKINPLSGAIQGLGAVAGGANDITSKAFELIPGVKSLEGLIGKGVGALASTPAGQAVGKFMQDFSNEHPELSKDIGAGFNIATAIPIFKGIGLVKNVAADGLSMALKGIAEKGAIKDLTEVAGRTAGERGVIKEVPDAVETMVKERALPDIQNGRYVTGGALQKINDGISKIDEQELQPILEKISQKQNFGQSLDYLKKQAIQEAQNDPALREAGVVPRAIKQIEDRFNGWKYSYGNSVDLATENRLKIGSGKFTDWGTPEGSADKSIYSALQHNIEDVAAKNGMPGVSDINARMGKLINTKKLFSYLNGEPVKNTGLIHNFIRGAATAGGEMAGNAVGVPIAGAIVGNKTSGVIEKALGAFSPRSIRSGVLNRTAEGAARQTIAGGTKKITGLVGGIAANQTNR